MCLERDITMRRRSKSDTDLQITFKLFLANKCRIVESEVKKKIKTLNYYPAIIVSRADNFVKHLRKLPINNPKPDLLNINTCTKFG